MTGPFFRPEGLFVSYPRSGRAWVLTLFGEVSKRLGVHTIVKHSHDGVAINRRKYYLQIGTKAGYKNHSVLLVVRDPRDVLVSNWFMLRHHWRKHEHENDTLDEFVRHKHGAEMLIRWMNDWARCRMNVARFHSATYELLKEDPATTLRCMLSFLDVPVRDGLVEEVAALVTVDYVREQFPWSNKDWHNREGWAARRGEAGVAHEYLEADTCEWLNNKILEELDDYWECYFEPVKVGRLIDDGADGTTNREGTTD